MRLPDFLIVGAMKAGTTTLYRDLLSHPQVYFPLDKEPNNLTDDAVLTPTGRAAYEALFAKADSDQVCGEASTAYTKRPDYEGCAQRARRLLGPGLKVIYIIREPVARIISQHYHEYCSGRMSGDIDQEVRRCPRLLNYSRYAMQIEPWIETFGRELVRVVRFECYMADRGAGVSDLWRFLGLDPRPELVEMDKACNRSEGKPAARGWAYRLSRSAVYRRVVRPWLTPAVKDRLRAALMPKVPKRPAPPSAETVRYLIDALREDQQRLAQLLGLSSSPWGPDQTLRRYEQQPSPLEKSESRPIDELDSPGGI